MKKFVSVFLVIFAATSMLAQSGLTCDDPIPVDSNYQAQIDATNKYAEEQKLLKKDEEK